jgi:hypothetical protein
MGNYISAVRSLFQLTKLALLGLVASKTGSQKAQEKLLETLVYNQPAQPSQGDCSKPSVLDLDADCPYCR